MEMINETLAKRNQENYSFSSYTPGSATAEYNATVANVKAIAERAKEKVSDEGKERIDKLVDIDNCNTKAFASVTVGGAVAIHGIRVMNSRKGLFVAMPASNYVDENGETKFSEIAHPISKESRDMLNSKVMEAYHQALDEQQSEDESEDMSEDESESFTQSM